VTLTVSLVSRQVDRRVCFRASVLHFSPPFCRTLDIYRSATQPTIRCLQTLNCVAHIGTLHHFVRIERWGTHFTVRNSPTNFLYLGEYKLDVKPLSCHGANHFTIFCHHCKAVEHKKH